jgi:starch phosphorylase
LWPERFNSKTNGITQRRWLLKANPLLSELIRSTIGDGWITDLSRLRGLERFAGDTTFQAEFQRVKRLNKEKLAKLIVESLPVKVDPDSLFDIHFSRARLRPVTGPRSRSSN